MSKEIIDAQYVQLLKEAVVKQFGRTLDSPSDYDALSLDIMQKTGDQISPTTLKRLYGYIAYETVPRISTLSVLARYAGYAGWSDYCRAIDEQDVHDGKTDADGKEKAISDIVKGQKASKGNKMLLYFAVASVLAVIVLICFLVSDRDTPHDGNESAAKDTLIVISDADTVILNMKDSLQIGYEAIQNECLEEAERLCDKVLDKYGEMDIISYYEFVQKEYARIVFTELRQLVDQRTSDMFADEEICRKYNSEIFAGCRDFCAERLLTDFPQDELQEAYRKIEDAVSSH